MQSKIKKINQRLRGKLTPCERVRLNAILRDLEYRYFYHLAKANGFETMNTKIIK